MFLYKGGQTVGKGTYWEPDKGIREIIKDAGLLPGDNAVIYFKLPECYFLIPVLLLGLALSMAFPYGAGFVVFFSLIALSGALYAAGSASLRLLREMLGRSVTFGYSPTAAYMAGKKMKKRGNEESSAEGNNQ